MLDGLGEYECRAADWGGEIKAGLARNSRSAQPRRLSQQLTGL
jgi:hypothetical protein